MVAGVCAGPVVAQPDDNTLRVYLLIGQSNMEGHAYTYINNGGNTWNIPTLEFLLGSSTASTNYVAALPESIFTFKPHLDSSWINQRNDAWAAQYDSFTGAARNVVAKERPNPDPSPPTWPQGIQPLSPGFGSNGGWSSFGPELGMGTRLGDALDAPILLFKSNRGGTDLACDWRPPSAATARGGSVGINYTNTINNFKTLLDELEDDLQDDGKLNDYNNATGYAVSGVFWFQGWNTTNGSQTHYTTAQKIAEYDDNLFDLINDIRDSDHRIPDDLPLIVGESSDQNAGLNAQRQAGVDLINVDTPGSAVFFETDRRSDFWGPNPDGNNFTTKWGYHFYARAENLLEVGWKAGGVVLDNEYTGSLVVVPEPASITLLGVGAVGLLRRRRRVA